MNKIKKVLALILSISLLFLIGCSSNSNEQETTEAIKEPTGFVEMNIDEAYLQNAQTICSQDNLIVFMTTILKDDDGNIITPQGEEDYEKYDDHAYIIKYDAKENKLLDTFELTECPVTEIWGIELIEDQIIVFSNSEKKNAYYDLDMNFIKEEKRVVVDDLDIAMKSKYYTTMSAACDGYCYFDGSDNKQYLFFYDNNEEVYLFNSEKHCQPSHLNKENGYILSESFGNDGETSDYSVIDYKNAKEINAASINAKDYGYEFVTTNQSGFGNKYAVCVEYFSDLEGEKYSIKMFCWNYQNEPTNASLDITKYTDFETLNKQTIADIKDKYNIDIHINEECDNISDSVKCDEEINPILVCNNLLTIKTFLDSLPEGMIKETYSGFSDAEFDRDGIRLDIVSEITMTNDITDSVAAFAQRWSNPMEVCFAYNTISMSNLSHEFMHLFDHRIDDYLNTKDTSIFNEWEKLNGDFSHEYNENEEFHRAYTFDENQFINEYASSNDNEDRAVTFEYLYTSHNEDKPWLEYEGVKTKTDYLLKLIREAFPSVQKVKTAYWEQ